MTVNRTTAIQLTALVLSLTGAGKAEEAVLATGSRAHMPIVLLPDATNRQRQLAEELGDHLNRMSGATFNIVTGDGSTGIVLGTRDQYPMAEWDAPLAIRGHDGLESYGIRTSAQRILILGASDLGLNHGTTRCLEALGCRWFFSGAAWHVIPAQARLAVDLDLTDRPALLSRVIWYGWGHWDPQVRADYERWMRRNYMGQSLKVACSHAWQDIISRNREVFEQHPEYLALTTVPASDPAETGAKERGGDKFCISNPHLVALCRQYALNYFARHPDADMVSMEPSDGSGHCECKDCEKMGPIPERVHYLVNEVAKAVAERYPGKYVGTYAYHLHAEPPSFRLAPNVYVQITAGFTRGRYTFLELLDEWPRRVDAMGIYEYLNVWAWTQDMPGAARGANLKYLRERIPYYVAHGATTMSCESGSNFGPNGLGYLVASRLMWNPGTDVDAVCRDFYDRAFGPAAGPMQRYYERFDGGCEPLVSDHLLALACRDLAEASRLAAGRPDVQRRLDDLKLYLFYVRLMRDLEVTLEADREKRLRLVFRILNFAYRTRHRYIINSAAIRGRCRTHFLRGVEQPDDWDYTKMRDRTAWFSGGDYTHEETEQLFQEGLAGFQAQRFQERSFSGELVRGGSVSVPGATRACLRMQGAGEFLVQSQQGEALRFRLLTGSIPHYRDRRHTEWTVVDAGGTEVASGELPLTGEWQSLLLEVPGPGIYRLRIDDFGAGWGIECAPGTPCVWQLKRADRIRALCPMSALYFYVPKGTREVIYYVQGGPHTVLDGAGVEVGRIAAQPGNIIILPVSAGRDGQAWCLRDLDLAEGRLWFLNCPNYVAAASDELLVPPEALRE